MLHFYADSEKNYEKIIEKVTNQLNEFIEERDATKLDVRNMLKTIDSIVCTLHTGKYFENSYREILKDMNELDRKIADNLNWLEKFEDRISKLTEALEDPHVIKSSEFTIDENAHVYNISVRTSLMTCASIQPVFMFSFSSKRITLGDINYITELLKGKTLEQALTECLYRETLFNTEVLNTLFKDETEEPVEEEPEDE